MRYILVFVFLLFANTPLLAQNTNMFCTNRADLVAGLADKYKEYLVILAVTYNGNLAETYTNADRSTWTTIITDSNKQSCIVMSGTYITILYKEIEGDKP